METSKSGLVAGKYTIPAGCGVVMSPFATHRLSSIYPEPEKFDPDRFLVDTVQRRHKFAFIPFSRGPRNCIGQLIWSHPAFGGGKWGDRPKPPS
jgi:cytochrome P450